MAELDTSLASWPFDLAWKFLDAATCCGFDCGRLYVSDGTLVEGMPPGCPCQLVAVVDAVWEPVSQGAMALCLPRKQAMVSLLLDLCIVEPGQDEGVDAKAINLSARDNVSARWRIMQGLQQARSAGNLGGECRSIVPAGWFAVSQTGGIARWQTSWKFTTE